MSIGKPVKDLREGLGMSQQDVADMSDGLLSRSYVGQIESGTNMGRSWKVKRGLANAFNLTEEAFDAYLRGEFPAILIADAVNAFRSQLPRDAFSTIRLDTPLLAEVHKRVLKGEDLAPLLPRVRQYSQRQEKVFIGSPEAQRILPTARQNPEALDFAYEIARDVLDEYADIRVISEERIQQLTEAVLEASQIERAALKVQQGGENVAVEALKLAALVIEQFIAREQFARKFARRPA